MTSYLSAFTVRRLTEADADSALEIARLCDIADTGEADTDLDDILEWLRDDATGRALGVAGSDGLDGYAYARKWPGHSAIDVDVRIRPGAELAAGPMLLERVRAEAARIDPTRPIHMFVHVDDDVRQGWVEDTGATVVRHFWRMVTTLDSEPRDPDVPSGVVVRPVRDDEADLRVVADVIQTAFAEHFGHEAGERPSYDEFVRRSRGAAGFDIGLWWLALVDGAPAAALIGRHFETEGIGFVNSLGTLAEFRGRGLGRALLLTAFKEFRARGLARAELGVDAANPTGAVRLYESVGMHAAQTWAVYAW
jgi:ribosomal protein S18 acetylase RimI-like enzyme